MIKPYNPKEFIEQCIDTPILTLDPTLDNMCKLYQGTHTELPVDFYDKYYEEQKDKLTLEDYYETLGL